MAGDQARGLPGEPTEAKAGRGSLRLAEDGRGAAQDPASGRVQGGVGVYLRGGRLQPRTDAESVGAGDSIRIRPGGSVPESLETGLSGDKGGKKQGKSGKSADIRQ